MHTGSVNTNPLLRYENTWGEKALGQVGRLYKIICEWGHVNWQIPFGR
jgi:hypothetical protein